jgi:phosphatidylglycerophosphate synthase
MPTYREMVRQMASAQKAVASGAPPYSILVNRRVGRLLAAWAYRRGLTPDAVTAISAAFTFTAIILVPTVAPAWWLGVVVWFGLALGYAFDSADGQVARLRGGGSLAGEWLDHVVDSVKLSSLHLAVLVMAYRFGDLPSTAWLLVPIGFALVSAVSFFTMILNDKLREVHVARHGGPARQVAPSSARRRLLLLPTDYGVLVLSFLTLGWPRVFFAIYVLLFVANLGHLVLALRKWRRDMVDIDTATGGAR